MKNKKYFLTAFLSFILAFASQGQDFEGKINFNISYENLTEEMKAYESMLPKEMNFVVKNDKSKMTQPNAMGETIVIIDQSTKKTTVLVDMMGKKIALVKQMPENTGNDDQEISYMEGTKEIAGYTTKKAIISDSLGNKSTIWYTEEIPSLDLNIGMAKLKGFPLEYEIDQNGLNSRITAVKVSKEEIADAEFEIPAGYKEMNQEEFQQMMQQGQ